jgi:bifunctional non-homologous end joining protein LigD
MEKSTLRVGNRNITVSNLDKILYPGGHFTKARVIEYYSQAAPVLLPHFHNRPVTLVRYPEGVFGQSFYEKNAPGFAPDWVKTFPVPRGKGGVINYILINDVATLVWSANLAALELHPFLHRAPRIDRPTHLVFDLDPGEGADVLTCAHVALLLRQVLSGLNLQAFPKVSGSKGIQVYVPLNTPITYDVTQAFARAVADLLTREHPKLVLARMPKALRKGKVFIDWSQNNQSKTTVGVYSLRAKHPQPFVSMPVDWEELNRAMRARSSDPLFFSPEAALARIKKRGDLFAPVLKLKQRLPEQFLEAFPREASAKHLGAYAARRDFSQTNEPRPITGRRSAQGSRRRFVVQQHAARHLHYDFRLEIGDVLKSWAVPKGVPLQKGERRSAFETEDHPIDYLEFEGIIPQGQYGGGTVMVWDIGTFDLVGGNYYAGALTIFLTGKKLKGEWVLKRLERDPEAEAKAVWLLIKNDGAARRVSQKRMSVSAVSGRTMQQISDARSAVWQSNRAQETAGPPARTVSSRRETGHAGFRRSHESDAGPNSPRGH